MRGRLVVRRVIDGFEKITGGVMALLSPVDRTALFVAKAAALFVFGVLGLVARLSGFSIIKFIRLLKDDLLIILGTSSSESVLPRMLVKMENAGCAKPVVGLVIPTGYSFNLDGTCIYLTMAAIFIDSCTPFHGASMIASSPIVSPFAFNCCATSNATKPPNDQPPMKYGPFGCTS